MRKLTIQEYSELEGISISTVYRKMNKLKTVKKGRHTYILTDKYDSEDENNESDEKKREEEVNKNTVINENEKLKLEKDMYLEQIRELKKDKENLNNQLAMSQSNIQNLSKSFQQLEYKEKEEKKGKKWWQKIFS